MCCALLLLSDVTSTSPRPADMNKPSSTLHFLQSFLAISFALMMCLLSLRFLASWRWKGAVALCSVLGSAWYISHAHSTYLTRAVLISEITAVDNFLQSLQTQSLHLPPSAVMSTGSNTSIGPVNTVHPFIHHGQGPVLETSLWVNGLLASLWDKERGSGGGLGEYLSKLAMEMINEQLKDLPPGIGI
jgi:hypothetical protein